MTKMMTAAALILTVAAPVAVAADESPWYGGLSVGRAEVKRPNSWAEQTDLTLRGLGVTGLTNVSTGKTSWKLFGGYQYNENLAVEAQYASLGRFGSTTAVTAPAAGTGSGKWDASAFSVAAVGILPIQENRVSAFGKLGLALTMLDVNVTAPRGGAIVGISQSNNRANLMLGVGLQFEVTKKIGIRAEFEHYNNVGDGSSVGQSAIDVWTIGALYRF